MTETNMAGNTRTETSRIGLALGSGAARGWAHIGVLRSLHEADIVPGVVCGTSIGALVGAFYATGQLDTLESWVRRMNWREIVRYLDVNLIAGGGFVEGARLMDFLKSKLSEPRIEDLDVPYAAVATDLNRGQEVWFRDGPLIPAVRASIALPGMFTPARQDDTWLVDGGLVNPVPVSLCRAMGADVVIAVNLNGDILGRHARRSAFEREADASSDTPGAALLDMLPQSLHMRASLLVSRLSGSRPQVPGLFDVITGSINIMQDRITRSRMAGDPPTVALSPGLRHIGLMEFDRAEEAIEEGRAAVRRMLPALREAVGLDGTDPEPATPDASA
jgi:NTE family protein